MNDLNAPVAVHEAVAAAVERWREQPGDPADVVDTGRRYLRELATEGWSVPSWPGCYGGRDSAREEVTAALQARHLLGQPDLYPFMVGLAIVGPTLLHLGTVAQRERWLRAIADGSAVWCQMFSEPDAGSDLANVHTTASPVRDGWVLHGQKVWTSRAMYADWGLCLVRTDPSVPKHQGLTMVAVDMAGSGIEVRPLVQMNHDAQFSEVYIDGYRAGSDDVVGDVGGGWRVAMTVLGHERGAANDRVGPPRVSALPPWLALNTSHPALHEPVTRDLVTRALILEVVARLTALRAASARALDRAGPEGSGAKQRAVEAYWAMARARAALAGADAMLDGTDVADVVLTAPSMSIRGGTGEIQRNILAERVLGLPVEPRLDRDVPWIDTIRRAGHP